MRFKHGIRRGKTFQDLIRGLSLTQFFPRETCFLVLLQFMLREGKGAEALADGAARTLPGQLPGSRSRGQAVGELGAQPALLPPRHPRMLFLSPAGLPTEHAAWPRQVRQWAPRAGLR